MNEKIPMSSLAFVSWLCCYTLLPFSLILGMSFLERGEYGGFQPVFTVSNYLRAFDWVYLQVFLRTVWLALMATATCLAIGFPVAYFLARTQGPMRQLGLVLLFIPFWTNFILRIYGIVSIAGNQGLVNQLLMNVGLIDEPLRILYTRLGVYIGLVYNYLPFLVVPIYTALEKLDPSLVEAAADLGAKRWQILTKVTLPCIREGLVIGSLFVFIPMMGEYVIPDLLGGAKEAFLGNIMVSQFFVMQDWPFGSALAGILSMMLLVGIIFQERWRTRSEQQKRNRVGESAPQLIGGWEAST